MPRTRRFGSSCASYGCLLASRLIGSEEVSPVSPTLRRSSKRVAQEQMTRTLPYIAQRSPERITRREHLAHHHAEPPVARHAARNLRCQGQELLRHEPLFEEFGK